MYGVKTRDHPRPDLGHAQLCPASCRGVGPQPGHQGHGVVELASVVGVHGHERFDGVRHDDGPTVGVMRAATPAGQCVQGIDHVHQPPHGVDVAASQIVKGHDTVGGLTHVRRLHQQPGRQPVQTLTPGAVVEPRGVVPWGFTAVDGVDAPPGVEIVEPSRNGVEVIIGDAEPTTHRTPCEQAPNLADRKPPTHSCQQRIEGVGHCGGGGRRRVDDFHRQTHTTGSGGQHRPHKRSEDLQVGADHHDVPRGDGGIVVHEVQQCIAQHLNLTAGAMALVDLDAAVAPGQHIGCGGFVDGQHGGIAGDGCLYPAQDRIPMVATEHAEVARQRAQQRHGFGSRHAPRPHQRVGQ